MKNKLIILLSAYLIIIACGIFSCNSYCDSEPDKFKTTGFVFETSKVYYSDTAANPLTIDSIATDSILFSEFGIHCMPQNEYYYSVAQIQQTEFITSANACSPPDPTTDELLDSISITCSTIFDNEHLAGSNISNMFSIIVYDNKYSFYYKKIALTEYLKMKPTVPSDILLVLNTSPTQTTKCAFSVNIYISGKVKKTFSYSSNNIVIKK